MRSGSALSGGSAAVGVSRFGMLLLVLGGIFAMHGLVATVGGMEHYSSVAVAVAAAGHGQPMPALAADLPGSGSVADRHPMPAASRDLRSGAAAATLVGTDRPVEDGGSHWLMAACVFVLCGVLLLLAARLSRVAWSGYRPLASLRSGRPGGRPERPPPRPLFFSLCVLRL